MAAKNIKTPALLGAIAAILTLKVIFAPSKFVMVDVDLEMLIALLVGIAIFQLKRAFRRVPEPRSVVKKVAPRRPALRRIEKNREAKEKDLRTFVGQTCIFKESRIVCLVTVADVVTDDWGARFHLRNVAAPGFVPPSDAGFVVDGAWEILHSGGPVVFAEHVGWMLIGREDVVEEIVSLARELAGQKTADEISRSLIERIRDFMRNPHPPPQDLPAFLNRRGLELRAEKRYAEAERSYREALAILEAGSPRDDASIALLENNLAGVVGAQNRLDEAEALFLKAVTRLECARGPDDADLGGVLRGLGGVYIQQERHGEAKDVYLRSLAIEERVLGPDHLNLSHTLNNISGIYMALGSPVEAEQALRRSIAIREKTLDPDHVLIGIAAQNLATFLDRKTQPEEVERLYVRTASIFEKQFGPKSAELADCLDQYAQFLGATDPAKANEVAARARSIRGHVN